MGKVAGLGTHPKDPGFMAEIAIDAPANGTPANDHFVERDGVRYAGDHLLVDLWDAARLDDMDHIDQSLRRAAQAAGATLLRIDLHQFTDSGGISGVAIIAESHISIHTWPERGYAAIDVFMCGDARAHDTIAVFREAFSPGQVEVAEHRRGMR
jgi:S-adenosylmethionine decarboxylase